MAYLFASVFQESKRLDSSEYGISRQAFKAKFGDYFVISTLWKGNN